MIIIFEKTGRRITFEYSLVHGVNDTPEDAKRADGNLKRQKLPFKPDSGEPDQGEILRKPDKKVPRISKINLKKTE